MHARPDSATVERRPEVRLRLDKAQAIATAAGATNPTEIARLFGVTRTTLARVWQGTVRPGEEFIASALAMHPTLKFEDLFEVVR